MNTMHRILKDDGARHDAISGHDRSILVEAGAGSGKTAVMAGAHRRHAGAGCCTACYCGRHVHGTRRE